MPARILPFQPMQIALAIAGSDPTGGAGLQLDLQVFRSLGVHGAGVLTALTIQDTAKVHQVLPVFPSVVGYHQYRKAFCARLYVVHSLTNS